MSQEEKPKTRNQSYRERMVLLLRDIKMKSGCVICGYKEHWAALDFHHRDPFDRLLIAQAISEQLVIMTHDESFKNYEVKLIQ